MNGLSGATRLGAAFAALAVNVVLAGGLVSLAGHYGDQAEQALALAGRAGITATAQASAVRCTPERARTG